MAAAVSPPHAPAVDPAEGPTAAAVPSIPGQRELNRTPADLRDKRTSEGAVGGRSVQCFAGGGVETNMWYCT